MIMELKDIYFGKTDAKNELTEDSDSQKETFEQAYLLPDGVQLSSLMDGSKYIVSGPKGIGKTALLRYIDIQLRKDSKNNTSFILFKSDLSAEDRKEFYNKSQCIVDESELKTAGDIRDYETVWQWFFYSYIYHFVKNDAEDYFEMDKTWRLFEKSIRCVELVESPVVKKIRSYIPHVKQGRVKLSRGGDYAELGFNTGDDLRVDFSEVVSKAGDLFSNLTGKGEKKLYLLVDELEISYELKKQYDRDVRLIRDLIVTIEHINALLRRNGFNIYIIASIRSEILSAVNAIGKEINKCVEDFGIQIAWHQSGGSLHDHPLIHIIMKRLLAAEKLDDTDENREKVWNQYFPDKTIQRRDVESYILYNSWYRPRDMVRFLTQAQRAYPNATAFTHQVFDKIRKTYSSECWTECMEELKAKYKNDQISAIESIFNGWKSHFTLEDFGRRIAEKVKYDNRLNLISDNIIVLLENLYRVGVIGNSYIPDRDTKPIVRFVFRGDDKLLPDKDMMVHNALKPYFSLR